MSEFEAIPVPKATPALTSVSQFNSGPPIEPISRLFLYSPNDWESFIEEWVAAVLSDRYGKVVRFTGAGDKGIDIAGFVGSDGLDGSWDNFQCKHLTTTVSPTVAWPEIGKILWHSYGGSYKAPRGYYFVAPRGVGTKLGQLLAHAGNLKKELKSVWDKNISREITSKEVVPLSGDFADYVEAFDFSVFKWISPRELIEQHRKTPYFIGRFGGALPARPLPDKPPGDVQGHEQQYVAYLLEAYADHKKEAVPDVAKLKQWKPLLDHLGRQRESFYHAESLRIFLREKVEPGTYESLQDEVLSGVIDTAEDGHIDGFQCVKAVLVASQNLSLDAHPLGQSALVKDRHGICHQLANDDRLKWTR
jgi:hypothetical protein